jgi:hypothetical protein
MRSVIAWRGRVAADTIITLFVDATDGTRYRRRDSPGFCRIHPLDKQHFRAIWEDCCREHGRQSFRYID